METIELKKLKIQSQYPLGINDIKNEEFTRLSGVVFVDHAASTLYSERQIDDYFSLLKSYTFSNPHSRSLSSDVTLEAIESMRTRILSHFNTSTEEYDVIFTSGATEAAKVVAQSFPWNSKSCYMYTLENHTSILGIREIAAKKNASIYYASAYSQDKDFSCASNIKDDGDELVGLFAYPAQCNFSGRKYPLRWVNKITEDSLIHLNHFCIHQCNGKSYDLSSKRCNWYVFLDASSFVSTSVLDLSKYKPDFVPISFYKLFGFPTGLGCLLVSKRAGEILTKSYFGGGTVLLADSHQMNLKPRLSLHERFEDGTLPFLCILALKSGFDTIQRITGGMKNIESYVFNITKYLIYYLRSMRHCNGRLVCEIYGAAHPLDSTNHGSIVNFNLKDDSGQYIGYSQVEKMASIYNIHLRTGCMCNPGACQKYLKISSSLLWKQFEAGHTCGDANDVLYGRPTGSVRVSFGYMSTYEDADRVILMIEECFVNGLLKLDTSWLEDSSEDYLNGFLSPFEYEFSTSPSDFVDTTEGNTIKVDYPLNDGLKGVNEKLLSLDNLQNLTPYSTDIPSDYQNLKESTELSIYSVPVTKTSTQDTRDILGRNLDMGFKSDADRSNVLLLNIAHQSTTESISSHSGLSEKSKTRISSNDKNIKLENIIIYPVKSCSGVSVLVSRITTLGLEYDRNWMIVTSSGVTLTQKRCPKMCCIQPGIDEGKKVLFLTFGGERSPDIPLKHSNEIAKTHSLNICTGRVCGDRVKGICCGLDISNWLSSVMGIDGLRLIRQTLARKSKRNSEGRTMAQISLVNECQFLIVSRLSLLSLQRNIYEKSGILFNIDGLIKRFRPNFVVDGDLEPFEEDYWQAVVIGSHRFDIIGGCSRCQMVCVDPLTGSKTTEPLLTLRELRGHSMTFGSYASFSEEILVKTEEKIYTGERTYSEETARCEEQIDSEDRLDIQKLNIEDKIHIGKELDTGHGIRSEDGLVICLKKNLVNLYNGMEVKLYFK